MNKAVNRIGDVYRYTNEELRTPTVVMYPGDMWRVGERWDSTAPIRNYESDFARALASTPDQSPPVPLAKLEEAAIAFRRKTLDQNNGFLLRRLSPSIVRLRDLNIDVELSYRYELRQVFGKRPDIITSSDSLMYCFRCEWGGNALEINGRYEAPASGRAERFFRIFRVPQYNSAGKAVDLRLVARKLLEVTPQAQP
jgi:hypothetical protein